jgi:hypothetical protein
MEKAARAAVALVSSHDSSPEIRSALERAGYDVTVSNGDEFRESKTAFSTFVETYKPDVIILDLPPPADDALKDFLAFKSAPSAEGRRFIVACSHEPTRVRLPGAIAALPFAASFRDSIVRAVRDALRRAA